MRKLNLVIYYPFQKIHSDPGQIPRFPCDLTGQIEKIPPNFNNKLSWENF